MNVFTVDGNLLSPSGVKFETNPNDNLQLLVDTTIEDVGVSSTSSQIYLPLTGTGDIDWGDGNVSTGVSGYQLHDYGVGNEGIYTIKISNSFTRVHYSNNIARDRKKLLEIQNWGNMVWSNKEAAFYGCSNMDITATDKPDISNTTTIKNWFRNCFVLTNTPDVETSHIVSMEFTWQNCYLLEKVHWMDTSNVTNMNSMWRGCRKIKSIPFLDTSKNTNFASFIRDCYELTSIPMYDTSQSTGFSNAFRNLSAWNGGTFPLFDLTKLLNGSGMFTDTDIDDDSWSDLLIGLEATNSNTGYTIEGGNNSHNASAQVAIDALVADHGVTVIDGGLV